MSQSRPSHQVVTSFCPLFGRASLGKGASRACKVDARAAGGVPLRICALLPLRREVRREETEYSIPGELQDRLLSRRGADSPV